MFSLHTRRTTYQLVVWSMLALEGVFGWRAGLMYSTILGNLTGSGIELTVIVVAMSIGLGVFGFFLATHRQQALEAQEDSLRTRKEKGLLEEKAYKKALRHSERMITLAVVLVVVHDVGGALYTVLASVHTLQDLSIPLVAAAVAMSALAIVPFLIGPSTQALADGMVTERQQHLADRTIEVTMGLQLGALERKVKDVRHSDPDAILNAPIMRLLKSGNLTEAQQEAIQDFVALTTNPSVPAIVAPQQPEWQQQLSGDVSAEITYQQAAALLGIEEDDAFNRLTLRPKSPGEMQAHRNKEGTLVTTPKEVAKLQLWLREQQREREQEVIVSEQPPTPPAASNGHQPARGKEGKAASRGSFPGLRRWKREAEAEPDEDDISDWEPLR